MPRLAAYRSLNLAEARGRSEYSEVRVTRPGFGLYNTITGSLSLSLMSGQGVSRFSTTLMRASLLLLVVPAGFEYTESPSLRLPVQVTGRKWTGVPVHGANELELHWYYHVG